MLLLSSAAITALLTWARIPAALLLGAMISGILAETGGAGILVPRLPFTVAQGIIGCMIARVLTSSIVHSFIQQWPIFLATALTIIAFCCFLGWSISRLGLLPGTTAVWGLLPGAASAMMLMADAYGADARLVAFMQYLRVVMVAVVASLIARLGMHATGAAAPVVWFPVIHWLPFIETLAIAFGGVAAGSFSKIPAGPLLVPMFAGAALRLGGFVDIELPHWLLAAAYLCLGWTIGLRFTRSVLVYALRALPKILLSIMTAILFCGGLSFLLTRFLGIDPLTAYLATSPGGADSVAIIAASSDVNVGFVMALQIARFMLVLFTGPIMSRFIADHIIRGGGAK